MLWFVGLFLRSDHVLRKGQDFTKDFMESKCKLVFPKAAESAGLSFSDTASFLSRVTSQEGVSRVLLVKVEGAIGLSCEVSH